MQPLPIDSVLPELIEKLRATQNLVLTAPPGAGKTTRVPPAILRANLLSNQHPNLIMLQPRRVAARAAAMRIAEENNWQLGREVGYHVRFDRKLTPSTRLRVLTEGILTRKLLADPFLEGVGAVLLDEFHERSIHSDLAIALLREVQQTVRPDLILVVMSATLEAEPISRYLGDAPIVRAEGRMFPVHIAYRGQETVADVMADVLEQPGDVLVFLPGVQEIRRTARELEPIVQLENLIVLPLHGSLTAEEQIEALRPANRRKIILATNIAETSLTIEGVRTVIDSGLVRIAGYDPQRGLDRLELKRISRASAAQRMGRAGRTAPGRCFRLWTAKQQHELDEFETPEIHRVDLCSTVLALHAWGTKDVQQFNFFEAPPPRMIESAERLLVMLGARSSESGEITDIGRKMLALPVHPRVARLLMGAAEHGMLAEGAAIAALLEEKDILLRPDQPPWQVTPRTQGQSDLLIRLELLAEAERERFARHLQDRGIDVFAARRVARTRDQLLKIAGRLQSRSSSERDETLLLKLVLLAYPDRVVRRRTNDPRAGTMVGGGGVRLSPESAVWQSEFFIALDARHDERSASREAIVRIASAIEPHWLAELFPHEIRRTRETAFDPQRQRVITRTRTLYSDLVLREDISAADDAQEAAAVLAETIRPVARQIFIEDPKARKWLARLALLRRAMPEHPWPAMDDDELAGILIERSQGKSSVDELRRLPLVALLQGRLQYPLDRMLEAEAPDSIQVPSGSRIQLDYEKGDAPVLAVRLQEIFGWTDTPRIAGGRVPIVLHLLGPNFRPVQITSDLRSFWATTYFQVRKDLRTRYPKHAWPEQPLIAKAQAKGGRQRQK